MFYNKIIMRNYIAYSSIINVINSIMKLLLRCKGYLTSFQQCILTLISSFENRIMTPLHPSLIS
jgi:hypothetical protein